MRRWVYALTAGLVLLTLFTIAAVVALGGEITALRRQLRTGTSMEALTLPEPSSPAIELPADGVRTMCASKGGCDPIGPNQPAHDTTLTITGSSRSGNVLTFNVRVQTSLPVSLLSNAPILADASGKGYAASKDSLDKASVAVLDLGQRGYADLSLDFPVGSGFAATEIIFNNNSGSAIAPTLRVVIPTSNQ